MTQIQNTDLHQVMSLLGQQDTEFHLRAKEKKVDGVKAMTLYVKNPNAHSFNIFAGRRPQKYQAAREFLKSSLVNAGLTAERAERVLDNAKERSTTKGLTIQLGKFRTEVEDVQQQYRDRLSSYDSTVRDFIKFGDSNTRKQKLQRIRKCINEYNFKLADTMMRGLDEDFVSAAEIRDRLSDLDKLNDTHTQLKRINAPGTVIRESLMSQIKKQTENCEFASADKSLEKLHKEIQQSSEIARYRNRLDQLRNSHRFLSLKLDPDPLVDEREKLLQELGRLINNYRVADIAKSTTKLLALMDLDRVRIQHQDLTKELERDPDRERRAELIKSIGANILRDGTATQSDSPILLKELNSKISTQLRPLWRQRLKRREEKHDALSNDHNKRRENQIKQINKHIDQGEFQKAYIGLLKLDQLIKKDETRQSYIARLDKLRKQHKTLEAVDSRGQVAGSQECTEILTLVEKHIQSSYSQDNPSFKEIDKLLRQLEEQHRVSQDQQLR